METNSREDNKNAESFSIESDKSKKKIKNSNLTWINSMFLKLSQINKRKYFTGN